MKLIFLLVFFLIILFLYLKIKNDTEKYESISVDSINSVTKYECNLLIDTILMNINTKYNKKLVRGGLDRVEKTIHDDSINYKITIFIYNTEKFTNKKIEFDITYNNNNIVINDIKNGNSRDILNEERDGIASRGSILYKPIVNTDNISPYSTLKNNHVIINYNSTIKPQDDKNKWILPLDAPKMYTNKPNEPLLWDSFGISNRSTGCNDKGIIRPNFFVSNFTKRNDLYDWMFDPANVSLANRPI